MNRAKKITCAVTVIIGIVLGTASQYKSDAGNPLRFSKQAMEVMGNAEGCRRDPYQCPADILTQGLGHTGAGTGSVSVATDQQIADWFARDQMAAQNCIESNVEKKIGRRLPQGVFDGVGSFVFNVGCTKFRSSTMYKNLLSMDFIGACNQLPAWVYAAGKVLPGLVTRRDKEKALCLSH